MRIKETFNNVRDALNLNNPEQKKGLIELLLIVGSLVVAFKTPEDLTSHSIAIRGSYITQFFMIFALLSILYFILIQTEIKEGDKKIKQINDISLFIALFFSAIMAVLLAMSTIKDIEIPLLEAGSYLIIFFAYWLPFTFFILGCTENKKLVILYHDIIANTNLK